MCCPERKGLGYGSEGNYLASSPCGYFRRTSGSRAGSQPGMFRQPERDKPSRDCVLNPSLLRPIRLRAASSFSGRTYNTTEHNTHQAQYLKLAKLARA